MSAQLIELVWRNKSYEKGLRQHGALFGGFSTEVNSDYTSGAPSHKVRTEYKKFDRQFVYPGFCEDDSNAYYIGGMEGWDPSCASAAGGVPPDLQLPRAVLTSSRDEFRTPAGREYPESMPAREVVQKRQLSTLSQNANGQEEIIAEGAQNSTQFREETFDTSNTKTERVDMNAWGPEPDCKIRKVSKSSVDVDVRTRFAHDEEFERIIAKETGGANREARITMTKDINWASKGDTQRLVALDQHVAGARATLKKIVLQFSKEDHQVSEVVVDFTEVVGMQGSVNSSIYMNEPKLTIFCDGKKRIVEAYYDVEMGSFADSKFHLNIDKIVFFPPLAGPVGGFDPGSHVATVVPTFGGVQPTIESSVMTAYNADQDDYKNFTRNDVCSTKARSTSASACTPFYAQLIPPDATGRGAADGRNSNLRALHFDNLHNAGKHNPYRNDGTEAEEFFPGTAIFPMNHEEVLFDNCDHLARNMHHPMRAPQSGPEKKDDDELASPQGDRANSHKSTVGAARRVLPTPDVKDATMPPAYEAAEMTRFYDKSLQMACAQRAAVNRGTSLTTMPAYSSFSVQPRRSNGTLLAVNVTLEARA